MKDIYDVERFITSLKGDVRVVRTLPTAWVRENESVPLKPFQISPPRDAPVSWYETTAVEKVREHGAVFLTPFSSRLFADDLDNLEYQRLRCRVAYHALRFTNDIRNLTSLIVERLRSGGPYVSVHLRFELDMLAYAGCLDSFNSTELKSIREGNYVAKELDPSQSRLIGKCPLSPKEVGLFLRALGFDNSTRVYLAAGEVLAGSKFLDPLRELFPSVETRMTLATPEELALVNGEGRSLLGPAVDYVACLLSEIFVPNYDGPSNFANNLIGQRLYFGFRTTLRPDRTALSPIFSAFERGTVGESEFQASVRQTVSRQSSGSPRARPRPRAGPAAAPDEDKDKEQESFYTNPWPECFCSAVQRPDNLGPTCPSSSSHETTPELISDLNYYDQDQNDNLAGWIM